MFRFEWKKLMHNPIPLIVVIAYIITKICMLVYQLPFYQADYTDRLMDELYGNMTFAEIRSRIEIDTAEANAALEINMSQKYVDGEISLEEYREWNEGASERNLRANALNYMYGRMYELGKLNSKYELSVDNAYIGDHADWIAKWKPITLLHEKTWNAVFEMEKISFAGYAVILLIGVVYTEMWKPRMAIPMRTSKNGWHRTEKAKRKLCMIILSVLWLSECLLNYALPLLLCGNVRLDAAIQSLKRFSDVVLPLSLGEYVLLCCFMQLLGFAFIALFVRMLSIVIRSTYAVLGGCLSTFMLMQALDPWRLSTDKLFVPTKLLITTIDPKTVIITLIVYTFSCAVLEMTRRFLVRYSVVYSK